MGVSVGVGVGGRVSAPAGMSHSRAAPPAGTALPTAGTDNM